MGHGIVRGGVIVVCAAVLGDLLAAAAFLIAAELLDGQERI